jgi:threonine/homoserine/homoserine lactone efflux protein
MLLGLSAAVPIGPVNVEIMRRGLRGGFLPALSVGLGAATIDGIYSIVFTLGFTALPSASARSALGWVGAVVLILLGLLTIRGAWREEPENPGQTSEFSSKSHRAPSAKQGLGGYLVGLVMTATNPMTLVFWASVGATLGQLPLHGVSGKLVLAGGVVGGALLWVFGFAAALHSMRHRISARTRRLLTGAGGLGILCFGVRLLVHVS